MIEIASAIGRAPAPAGAAGAMPVGDGAAFALSLASFLSLQEGTADAAAVPTPAVTGQDDATGGKALPEGTGALPEEAGVPPAMGMVPFIVAMPVAPVAIDPVAPTSTGSPAPVAAEPMMPGVAQGGGSPRPAMLAGTGLAVVQLATVAAEAPATVEVPAAVTSRSDGARASIAPASAEVASPSTQPLAVPGGGPGGSAPVGFPAGGDKMGLPAAMATDRGPVAGAAPMTIPARFAKAAAGSDLPTGVTVVEPGTDAVPRSVAANPGAPLAVPVPARFALPVTTQAGADSGVAQAPVANDTGAAAAQPAGITVQMEPGAPSTPASVRPAAVSAEATPSSFAAPQPVGASRTGQEAPMAIRPATGSDGAMQISPAMDRGAAPRSATADMPQPIKAGDAAPAFQLFASALHRDAGLREDRGGAIEAPLAPGLVAPVATVPATAAAQDAPLDMRQDQWPQGMIDRIEALRDQADANDTRIRLVPDALGTIDIAISRRDDQVHVRFEAEQAQTRAMLAQAQPELTALASARGLKLGEATPDARQMTGGGQDMGQNPGQDRAFTQQQHQPRTLRNRTSAGSPADSLPDDSAAATRIA